MKVILIKNVENVGLQGDVLDVKNGYGRNYLLPNHYAILWTKESAKKIDLLKISLAKQQAQELLDLEEVKKLIEGLNLEFKAKVKDDGKLFGSIKESHILKELKKNVEKISKENIESVSFNEVGEFEVPIILSPELKANLKIKIIAG